MADLPINTFDTAEQAVSTSRELIAAGAHAVKLEGGASHVAQVRAISDAGIPVMAHIGMQPQRVRIEGGYRIKGKTVEEADALLADAAAAEHAGAFGLLLELVQPDTAQRITSAAKIPTVGIGSGTACDGQVLVTHDLIGLFPWFRPKFAKPAADVAGQITAALGEYLRRVKPAPDRTL